MKLDEPSRTALIPARQRAAPQVLDHGSILNDLFALKILREDEIDVLQFANQHPLASIGPKSLRKWMSAGPAVSSRVAWQRSFTRTDFLPSKTSASRRSRPGSAAPFKDSHPDTSGFMLSTPGIN